MGDCPSQVNYLCRNRNTVNFLTYQKLLNNFKKVLKNSSPLKFGRPRMRFILIIHGTWETKLSEM